MQRHSALLLVMTMAAAARAEPMTFFFEGYIDTLVDFGLDQSVAIGTPFSGSYTFDPASTHDQYPDDPSVAFYGFVWPSHLSVTLGNYEFVTNDLIIVVFDNTLTDHYGAHNWTEFYSGGFQWYGMGISLLDTTRTALDSDVLPLSPPDLSAFTTYTRFDSGIPGYSGSVLGGPLISLTPEPGSLAFLSVGAVIVIARGRHGGGPLDAREGGSSGGS